VYTDEEHPTTIADIQKHLITLDIHANRKTVAADMQMLLDSGFDIVQARLRQNQYFIGSRNLELAELKMIVDAVQAAKFISESKSLRLIEKVSAMGSTYQAEQLKRRLYVKGKAKTTNEAVHYTVDLLHAAIQSETAVEFQYIEYTPDKEKSLKHNGQIYRLSPYDLVWNNDSYYIFGWSESHGKVVKFRIDRMYQPKESTAAFHPRPDTYDIEDICEQVFMMYDGKPCTVTLRCANEMMKVIIDRFGEDVKTARLDADSFSAEVEVSASPTFYAWLFTYGGKLQILSPQSIKDEYIRQIRDVLAEELKK
ncbi:MAG: WYL domain-containing protein, partial [Clostridia bacterium]|nr:WYL domain-containing protein [Clostridia bacterium]